MLKKKGFGTLKPLFFSSRSAASPGVAAPSLASVVSAPFVAVGADSVTVAVALGRLSLIFSAVACAHTHHVDANAAKTNTILNFRTAKISFCDYCFCKISTLRGGSEYVPVTVLALHLGAAGLKLASELLAQMLPLRFA